VLHRLEGVKQRMLWARGEESPRVDGAGGENVVAGEGSPAHRGLRPLLQPPVRYDASTFPGIGVIGVPKAARGVGFAQGHLQPLALRRTEESTALDMGEPFLQAVILNGDQGLEVGS